MVKFRKRSFHIFCTQAKWKYWKETSSDYKLHYIFHFTTLHIYSLTLMLTKTTRLPSLDTHATIFRHHYEWRVTECGGTWVSGGSCL